MCRCCFPREGIEECICGMGDVMELRVYGFNIIIGKDAARDRDKEGGAKAPA